MRTRRQRGSSAPRSGERRSDEPTSESINEHPAERARARVAPRAHPPAHPFKVYNESYTSTYISAGCHFSPSEHAGDAKVSAQNVRRPTDPLDQCRKHFQPHNSATNDPIRAKQTPARRSQHAASNERRLFRPGTYAKSALDPLPTPTTLRTPDTHPPPPNPNLPPSATYSPWSKTLTYKKSICSMQSDDENKREKGFGLLSVMTSSGLTFRPPYLRTQWSNPILSHTTMLSSMRRIR